MEVIFFSLSKIDIVFVKNFKGGGGGGGGGVIESNEKARKGRKEEHVVHKSVNRPESVAGPRRDGGASLLGLMAKIKCSICSYQFNIWYAGHSPAQILI